MAPKSNPLQLILAELASIKAGNEALQQTLAQQEAQHRSDLATLWQDFEERLAVIQQSASRLKKVVIETKDSPALETTQKSGNGSSPSQCYDPMSHDRTTSNK
ncbi:hypothetical protein BU25DRAFT_458288 [Macroventuria anomochaeta]|uniref:Uncharacterized protein n=1 Tax=Macroventuria anomochaeta TaxID=301207 RepID=A0ACB6S2Z5_9PLEO|nr:uncharacterized protein BU25DRAFT_458288 [Macroventuria anomochaeta]KAF2627897.1 hypothetical protein BU25DRAFT_458288 [Macroventuria anomochaeta]